MSAYRRGISAETHWFPAVLEPARNRVGQVVAGYNMVRTGESTMYPRGLGTALPKQSVGATSKGAIGEFVDAAVGFFVDAAHVGLIVLGLITVKKAIDP